MKLQFRPTSPEDAPAVAAFLQRIFRIEANLPVIEPRHMHWKYWDERPGWEGSRGYVLTREGTIVAHAALTPLTCVSGARRWRMAHLIDWAADPKSAGSGVYLLWQMAGLVDAILATDGTEVARKVQSAFGFRAGGEVTRFARPLRPLRRLAAQNLSLRTGAQFTRSVWWWLRQPPRRRSRGWTAGRVAAGETIPEFVRWPSAPAESALLERSAAAIAYLLNCPATRMEFYPVAKGDRPYGYFLLAHAPGQTRIADFYADSEQREDWCALIELAVRQAKRNPAAAEVVSLGSDALTRDALLDCGFHARGSSAVHILPGKGVELPAAAIRVQMIDSDAAYLHANRSDYWS